MEDESTLFSWKKTEFLLSHSKRQFLFNQSSFLSSRVGRKTYSSRSTLHKRKFPYGELLTKDWNRCCGSTKIWHFYREYANTRKKHVFCEVKDGSKTKFLCRNRQIDLIQGLWKILRSLKGRYLSIVLDARFWHSGVQPFFVCVVIAFAFTILWGWEWCFLSFYTQADHVCIIVFVFVFVFVVIGFAF